MGKRIEKALGRDKGQASQSSQEVEEDPNKTPEPYICSGHFHTDFSELCRRNHMAVIPQVLPRPHRPPSPGSVPPPDESKTGGKQSKKDDKKNPPPPEPEPEVELDQNGEPPEPPPKTYTTKDRFQYFKPCVQVEMDNHDKQDTVTEVYVRGWKVDVAMMMIFKQCFPRMDRLQTINLWNSGLDEETLEILASVLPECPTIKNLVLDNNVIKAETWDQLIKEESPVQHLSVRYNKITDVGARYLGRALGEASKQNSRLLSLNLNGNQITDEGATCLADGLRMNRTLLCLGLANNKISDKGVKHFSDVLSRFALTHEEIVERRKLMSEKGSPERQKPLSPLTRRADSRDRPGSVRSSHTGAAGGTKGGKSAKAKKGDTKGKDDEKEKKSKKDVGGTAGKRVSVSSLKVPIIVASIVADMGKSQKKGEKTKGKGKGAAQPESEQPEAAETLNPLLETVERLDGGALMLAGNRTLLSLNLAGNQIGEEGIKALALAVAYQTSLSQFQSSHKSESPGLMRLSVHRNRVAPDNESMQKLQSIMATKDPFYKPPESPDNESLIQSNV